MDRFPPQSGKRTYVIFVLGILAWAAIQGSFINLPAWKRAIAPEPDDAYIYISKAPQMAACFAAQDCPALVDLRQQIDQDKPYPASWEASRARITGFTVYHPLHSVLLLALHKLGLSWDWAYRTICSMGSVLFLAGLAMVLHSLVGPGPAGLAMLLMAFQVFTNQGLHYVVPSNLALGIALVVWGRILAKGRDAAWVLALGVAAMLAMHPVGKVYGLVALLLSLVLGVAFSSRGRIAAWLLAAVMVGAAFGLPYVAHHPDLVRPPEPLPSDFNLWKFIHASFKEVVGCVHRLAQGTGGYPLLLAGLAAGFWSMGRERRKAVNRYLACIGLFMAAGLAYFMPHYPADVFSRVWIGFAVGLVAVVGYGLYALAALALRLTAAKGGGVSDGMGFLASPKSRRAMGWVLLLLLLAGVGQAAQAGVDSVLKTMDKAWNRYNYPYSLNQPKRLMDMSKPEDKVLYSSLFNMPFYFTHGALDLGAVYLPAVRGTDQEERWTKDPNLRFAVAMNPLRYLLSEHGGRILVKDFPALVVELPADAARHLFLNLRSPDRARIVTLRLRSPDTGAEREMQLDVYRTVEWAATLPLEGFENARVLELSFSGDVAGLGLNGLNLDANPTLWPWQSRARITFVPAGNEYRTWTFLFDPQREFGDLAGGRPFKVVDDAGATVLLELE